MLVRSLKLHNFKSHESIRMEFPERISVFTGKNGSGKTNLLDGLHHAGLLRSAFHRQDALNIKFGEEFYRLDAGMEEDGKEMKLAILCEREKKKQVSWNGKNLERIADHVGRVPLVLILPDEPFQMNESADWRRSAIDNVFSQAMPAYLEHLSRFKRFLTQRNALLRYFSEGRRYDPLLLDALDEDLALESTALFELRSQHLPALQGMITEEYRLLSSGREEVKMVYESQLADIPARQLLQSRRQQDLEAGRSTAGLQRDDYDYLLNGISLRKYASQGQQKSFLMALKLAQYRFLSGFLGKKPMLLLDDVFDKLDEERIAHLLRRIQEPEMGQVFITDAREERSRSLLEGVPCEIFSLENIRK
jgi:DNA replication and repair protein RecF